MRTSGKPTFTQNNLSAIFTSFYLGSNLILSRLHRSSWVQSGEPPSNNELVRKRMYRIGLNLFNKKPEKGLSFLIKHSFVADSPNVIANFLVTRKGISRQVLGEFLGSGTEKTKKILKSLCNEIDLSNLDVDEALRKFQSHIRIQVSSSRQTNFVRDDTLHPSNLATFITLKIISLGWSAEGWKAYWSICPAISRSESRISSSIRESWLDFYSCLCYHYVSTPYHMHFLYSRPDLLRLGRA